MNITTRLLLAACLVLSFAACKKEEAPVKVEAAPLTKPAGEDVAAWQPYVEDVVKRNMEGVNSSPYIYFLTGESSPDFQGEYDRMLEKVQTDLGRGIMEGTMLAFASPASAKVADIAVAGFSEVAPASMNGVKVLFLGDAADSARVEAAVAPSGATYKFVEAR
jgi:hypothetical protein